MDLPPLLANKHPDPPSVFFPSTLLREARRQKGIAAVPVPRVVRPRPGRRSRAPASPVRRREAFPGLAAAITRSLTHFSLGGRKAGIIGRVVGASFAVLVAEELFASGCELLVSLTSAGQIVAGGRSALFRCDRPGVARRGDELPLCPDLRSSPMATRDWSTVAGKALAPLKQRRVVGASWTTDAPFRETSEAIEAARAKGILCVEMEAAALYAFARAKSVRVLCLAHVTNTMGQLRRRFRKGRSGRDE